MNTTRILVVPLVAAAIAACAPQTQERGGSSESRSPIINGTVDSAHPSVVALLLQEGSSNQGSACTATIIQTDPVKGVGFVLTAAHCVEGTKATPPLPGELVVVEGNDYNDPKSIVYSVTAFQKHPQYGGNAGDSYDFALVKIAGVDKDTKVTPYATKAVDASLKVATKVDLVGYGKTSDTDTTNTTRHIIKKPIDSLTSLLIGFDQTNGGLCQGDSGGPVIASLGGVDHVVGVNSFVASDTGTCLQGGFSGRISAAQDWVKGYIDGTGGTDVQTCDECKGAVTAGKGACVDEQQACGASPGCVAYNDCLGKCAATDDPCFEKCGTTNAAGKPTFDAYASCVQTACKAACPVAVVACGFGFSDAACDACYKGACCADGDSCAADDTCTKCATGALKDAKICGANAAFTALNGCIDTSCPTECGGPPPKCGFTFAAGPKNDCFEKACCSEGSDCASDKTCDSCLGAKPPSAKTCKGNAAYTALLGCLSDSCAEEFNFDTGTGGASGKGGSTVGKGGSSSGKAGSPTGSAGSPPGTAGASSGKGGSGGSGGSVGSGEAPGSAGKGGSSASAGARSVATGAPAQGSGDSGGCSVGPADGARSGSVGILLAGAAALLGRAGARVRRRSR